MNITFENKSIYTSDSYSIGELVQIDKEGSYATGLVYTYDDKDNISQDGLLLLQKYIKEEGFFDLFEVEAESDDVSDKLFTGEFNNRQYNVVAKQGKWEIKITKTPVRQAVVCAGDLVECSGIVGVAYKNYDNKIGVINLQSKGKKMKDYFSKKKGKINNFKILANLDGWSIYVNKDNEDEGL